jgi:hypothetical protein
MKTVSLVLASLALLGCFKLGCFKPGPDDVASRFASTERVRLPEGFEATGCWSEGYLWVERLACHIGCTAPRESPVNRCGTFISRDGSLLTTNCLYVAYDTEVLSGDARPEFHDGIAIVIVQNLGYAYINASGDVLNSWRDDRPPWPLVGALIPKRGDELYGYIDKSGGFVIAPEFQSAQFFQEAFRTRNIVDIFAIVCVKGHHGVIDSTGRFTVLPVYDKIEFTGSEPLNDGTVVATKEGKCGLVSIVDGTILTALEYQFIQPHATFTVRPCMQHDRWGVVTEDDRMLVDPQFRRVSTRWDSNLTCCIELRGDGVTWKDLALPIQDGRIHVDRWYSLVDEFEAARRAIQALSSIERAESDRPLLTP